MHTYNVTALRKHLYQVIDQVIKTGRPVDIERKGRKLRLVPIGPQAPSKLTYLKKRKGIVGNPDNLVKIKVGTWNKLKNLKPST